MSINTHARYPFVLLLTLLAESGGYCDRDDAPRSLELVMVDVLFRSEEVSNVLVCVSAGKKDRVIVEALEDLSSAVLSSAELPFCSLHSIVAKPAPARSVHGGREFRVYRDGARPTVFRKPIGTLCGLW